MYKITLILLIGISSLFGASKFLINGNTINPASIKILRPSLSESSEIIIHSIVLENFQNSNLAFNGEDAYQPTAFQCKNKLEELTFEIINP